MGAATDVRFFRRIHAVWLAAEGKTFAEVAQITALGLRSVYRLVRRYLKAHRVEDLADKPREGRPPKATGLTRAQILRELRRSPLGLGYRTNVWTVAILAHRLNQRCHCGIGPRALHNRMKQIGLVCKRLRYFYYQRAAHVAQKKAAIVRKMKGMPANAVWLFEDETILRLLPEIRRAWSLRGVQAQIRISGENAKCVLFGILNPRTGHRIVARGPNMGQQYFQRFLRPLRRSYPGRQIWLVLDKASCHTTPTTQAVAESLDIVFIWLPKQWSELNGMDHLWKELKKNISANFQYRSIEQHADFAQRWIFSLSKTEALHKAGVLSKKFWLRAFLPKL